MRVFTKSLIVAFSIWFIVFSDTFTIEKVSKGKRPTSESLSSLDYQKPILSFPVREKGDKTTWIQGASANQKQNELYISKQSNGGTVLTIERRSISSGVLLDVKKLPLKSGTYAEGLPWFMNKDNELCFLVRQVPAGKVSIFNYDKNKIEKSFDLLGQSKIGYDIKKKYIVTSTVKKKVVDKIYVYEFESVIKGKPKLLHTVDTSRENLWFEKPQGITIHEDKIILAHGAGHGTPGISVVNLKGKIEHVFYFEPVNYAIMLNQTYPRLISDRAHYHYENEGIFMYEKDGNVYPALVQIVNSKTTIIVLAGSLDGIKVKTQ
jgi:hypothetical protein